MAAYTTIDDPEAYFQTVIYTGDGADDHAITLPGDTDMQPDLVWVKVRDGTDAHEAYDAVRGAQKRLTINSNAAEGTQSNGVMSFDSDGFTVDDFNSGNRSSGLIVAFTWKESATAGFDIVSYTGDGSNRTISHSLSAVPKTIFIKQRSGTTNWYVQFTSVIGNNSELYLDTSDTKSGTSGQWNTTDPTSSVFSLGTGGGTNVDAGTFIAYCFADVQGFSKFGSFEGTADADGPFVYTGFRPAFVMLKNADTAEGWMVYDNKRLGYNEGNSYFQADTTAAEASGDNEIDLLSNGFKLRSANTASNRADTHVYFAWAEAPLVNSNGVPCNAR